MKVKSKTLFLMEKVQSIFQRGGDLSKSDMKEIFIMGSIKDLELNIFIHNSKAIQENFIKDIILDKELNILKMERKFIKDFLLIINMFNLFNCL